MTAKELRVSVIAVSAFLFTLQVIALCRGVPVAIEGQADFRYLYTAGYMARTHGLNLYDRETNRQLQNALVSRDGAARVLEVPAYEALLFLPISFLKYRPAYIAFFAANLGLLGLSIRTLRPYLDKLERVWWWLPGVVVVCFFPTVVALFQGQDSIILLTLMLASAVAFYRGRDLDAGVFLGLTLFKFQFAVPIALLFLFWRRWRLSAGFLVTGVAVAVLSLLLAGVSGLRACAQSFLSWSAAPFAVERMNFGTPVPVIPNLYCLIHALAGPLVSPSIVVGATVVCSTVLLGWAATRTANFALAILVALLVSAHGTISDAVLLIIPVAMVLDARLTVDTGTSRLWSRNLASMLFVAPSICFLAGLHYCLLAPLMLGLLMPLRFTSSDSLPATSGAN